MLKTPKRVLADGEGFEPPERVNVRRFSKPVPSTRLSHPSDWKSQNLQAKKLHKIARPEKSPFEDCWRNLFDPAAGLFETGFGCIIQA